MKRLIFTALAALALSACDNKSATLDTNAYYAEQEQPTVAAPTVEDFPQIEVEAPQVVQQQQPVIIQQDDGGFDLGSAAIGFVAAEVLDEVGDAFETKHKKTYVAPVNNYPVVKRVEPQKSMIKVDKSVTKPTIVKKVEPKPVIKKITPIKPKKVEKVGVAPKKERKLEKRTTKPPKTGIFKRVLKSKKRR
ncbi:hypothetical protein VPFG_00194 [Vibrio phage nt-1]|uniref:Lipoprotein n=1 Tax=Vibrio phage nt-1 TaxID=115992 RepID=R9TFF0_9CAUD|nr:hypothetical protein VPFG_00194 [Vibrio phage nt-1]AGN30194.1 hypothetical protein VPFG_00194 [Vibrio phage nt-1]